MPKLDFAYKRKFIIFFLTILCVVVFGNALIESVYWKYPLTIQQINDFEYWF